MYVSQCRDKTNIFCDVCFRHDNMFSASWCFTPHWRRIRLKSKIHHKQHQTQQTNNKTLGYAVIISTNATTTKLTTGIPCCTCHFRET